MRSEKEVFWRETLRKSKTSSNSLNLNICAKFKRNSIRASILNDIDSKNISKYYSLKTHQSISESIHVNKLFYTSNLSKISENFKEMKQIYEEIIKKQNEELTTITSENQSLSKKIVLLNNADEAYCERSETSSPKADSDEEVINYYKRAIKKAEEMLLSQQIEYESHLKSLESEKFPVKSIPKSF